MLILYKFSIKEECNFHIDILIFAVYFVKYNIKVFQTILMTFENFLTVHVSFFFLSKNTKNLFIDKKFFALKFLISTKKRKSRNRIHVLKNFEVWNQTSFFELINCLFRSNWKKKISNLPLLTFFLKRERKNRINNYFCS